MCSLVERGRFTLSGKTSPSTPTPEDYGVTIAWARAVLSTTLYP